ncbi:MAG: DUF2769 domain-containing protein [Methanoregulaceae archaeon]
MNRREEEIMDRKKAIGLCICRMCPSFVDCNEEIAYCLAETGKSGCIRIEQGCLCPGCPVQEEEDFQHVYYCTRGSETGQSRNR